MVAKHAGGLRQWVPASLAVGAVAAIVASLVSLPLRSPDNAIFNTATVTVGALVAGLAGGALWWAVGNGASGIPTYVLAVTAGFVAVAVAALAGGSLLSHLAGFVIPLAAIIFALAALLPLLLPRLVASRTPVGLASFVLFVAAATVGVGLAGQGDAPSGRLSLPEPAATPEGTGVVRQGDVEGVTFAVVPSESVVTYTVREKLASLPTSTDAVGRTTALSGEVYLDGRLSRLAVDLSTLESDQPRRDQFVRDRVFPSDPIAQFVVEDLGRLPTEYVPGERVVSTVTGVATVRGVERPFTFDVEAEMNGDTLQVLARTDFTWADFRMEPPATPRFRWRTTSISRFLSSPGGSLHDPAGRPGSSAAEPSSQ